MRPGFLFALALALTLPSLVAAQSLDSALTSSDPFTVTTSPSYPTPNSTATVSVLSATLDLTSATMTVSVANKQVYQGSVRPVAIPVGRGGSVTTALVTIISGGTSYRQTIVIQPQDVSIIAEPLSSAPVLYPGKPLAPLGGDTRVVAVANFKDAGGKTLDPATLAYAWTVDGTQIANSSGIGKQAIIVASPLQYRSRTVSVVVQSPSGGLVGGASLSLDPVEPSVRLYHNDPLLGVLFDHALAGTYAINQSEDSLYAAPYSFPMTGRMPTLNWFLNGTLAQTGNTITLRPSGSGQGSATLSLTATNGDTETATADLSLIFGAKQGTNFFGL